jgi:hypothetical protein
MRSVGEPWSPQGVPPKMQGQRDLAMAFILIMIVALIWLVPLTLCLVMAMASWISPRFRRLCVHHLFGPEQPEPATALEGASLVPFHLSHRIASLSHSPHLTRGATRVQNLDVEYATMKVFRVDGSIALRSGLPITHVAASNAQERYSPRLAIKAAPPCKPSSWVSPAPFCLLPHLCFSMPRVGPVAKNLPGARA